MIKKNNHVWLQIGCICVGRLIPPKPGWNELCLRIYSPRGCSPCIPARAADATICPKILIEYA